VPIAQQAHQHPVHQIMLPHNHSANLTKQLPEWFAMDLDLFGNFIDPVMCNSGVCSCV
jgi:hypothetical protein